MSPLAPPMERLERALASHRLGHTLLFCGPAPDSLREAAQRLACAINCEVGDGATWGCGHCPTCEQLAAGVHPDWVHIEPDGAKRGIAIETIRERAIAPLAMPPHQARARIVVIDGAHAMAAPAANCLLKSLEEPPTHTYFLLLSTSPAELLVTIRSRCQRVYFGGIFAQDDTVAPDTEACVDDLEKAVARNGSVFDAARTSGEDRGRCLEALLSLSRRFHRQAHQACEEYDHGDARIQAARARQVLRTHTHILHHNANPRLAVEDLLLRLRSGQTWMPTDER